MTLAYQIEPARCNGGYTPSTLKDLAPHTQTRWVGERKYDGIRYLLQIRPNGAAHNFLTSRRISVKTNEFVEKQDVLTNIRDFPFPPECDGMVFDGEIVGSGISSDAQHDMVTGDVKFVVFDIIRWPGDERLDCTSLTRLLPMSDRRDLLQQWFEHADVPEWMQLAEQVPCDQILSLLDRELAAGREGIVLKHLDTPYGEGWWKVKRVETFDVVIMGYVESTAAKYAPRNWIKSVRFGQYRDGKLVEIGQTSGMTDAVRDEISKNREAFIGRVMEVEAQEQLKSGALRHPRFIRFRDDKNATDCIWSPK